MGKSRSLVLSGVPCCSVYNEGPDSLSSYSCARSTFVLQMLCWLSANTLLPSPSRRVLQPFSVQGLLHAASAKLSAVSFRPVFASLKSTTGPPYSIVRTLCVVRLALQPLVLHCLAQVNDYRCAGLGQQTDHRGTLARLSLELEALGSMQVVHKLGESDREQCCTFSGIRCSASPFYALSLFRLSSLSRPPAGNLGAETY